MGKRYWCKECWSDHLIKDGMIIKNVKTPLQRYRCMSCNYKSADRIDSYTDWRVLSILWAWYKAGQDIQEPHLTIVKNIDDIVKGRLACGNPNLTPETWQDIIKEVLEQEEVNEA